MGLDLNIQLFSTFSLNEYFMVIFLSGQDGVSMILTHANVQLFMAKIIFVIFLIPTHFELTVVRCNGTS